MRSSIFPCRSRLWSLGCNQVKIWKKNIKMLIHAQWVVCSISPRWISAKISCAPPLLIRLYLQHPSPCSVARCVRTGRLDRATAGDGPSQRIKRLVQMLSAQEVDTVGEQVDLNVGCMRACGGKSVQMFLIRARRKLQGPGGGKKRARFEFLYRQNSITYM